MTTPAEKTRNFKLLGQYADPKTRIISWEAARAWGEEMRRRGWAPAREGGDPR